MTLHDQERRWPRHADRHVQRSDPRCVAHTAWKEIPTMANRLAGKVALISGSARGMGASHAHLFVEEGACVVLADIRDQQGSQCADDLNRLAEARRAVYVHLDVTQASDWEQAVA